VTIAFSENHFEECETEMAGELVEEEAARLKLTENVAEDWRYSFRKGPARQAVETRNTQVDREYDINPRL
jgi:hypothetical protein